MSSGITKIAINNTTTLNYVIKAFDGTKGNKQLRYSKSKGLYTNPRFGSMTLNIRAKLGDKQAIRKREERRTGVVEQLSKLIEKQYGSAIRVSVFHTMEKYGTLKDYKAGLDVDKLSAVGKSARVLSEAMSNLKELVQTHEQTVQKEKANTLLGSGVDLEEIVSDYFFNDYKYEGIAPNPILVQEGLEASAIAAVAALPETATPAEALSAARDGMAKYNARG